jgi:hypothetical protein
VFGDEPDLPLGGARELRRRDVTQYAAAYGLADLAGHGLPRRGILARPDLEPGAAEAVGVAYQNDRMTLTGSFNPKDSTSFNVHSIGPRINITKTLMKWDKVELGVFAGVSVLFPFAGENETLTLVGSNGSVARIEYEAQTLISAGGGLRLAFDIPGL